MTPDLDLLVLGQRVRHARRRKGQTLAALGQVVGRPAPYLSRLENGKVEPKLGFLTELAAALDTTPHDLLDAESPDRRSELEIEIHRAQRDPRYRALGLAPLKPTAKVPDEVLEHIVSLWRLSVDSTAYGSDESIGVPYVRAKCAAVHFELTRLRLRSARSSSYPEIRVAQAR